MLSGVFKEIFETQIRDVLIEFMVEYNDQPYRTAFVDDVTNQFFMEMIKMEHDDFMMSSAKSFRQYYQDQGWQEDGRKRTERVLTKVKKMRKAQAKRLEDYFGYFPQELLIPDKKNSDKSFEGYRIASDQFEEIQNMMDIPIFEKFHGGQLGDSNKINNGKFKELYQQYDELIDEYYYQMDSDEQVVENTIKYFVIQWVQPLEFVYGVADLVDARLLPESYIDMLWLYCNPYNDRENDFHADNRFLMTRNVYIDMISRSGEMEVCYLEEQYVRQLYALQWLKDEIGREVFERMREITISEKADFIRNNYWIWDNREEKKWTGKRIQVARKIFNAICN